MDAISGMQQKILRYIQRTLDERGVAPSVREIGDAVGLSSTSSVQYNLNKLERMGCIERDPNCKRTIRLPGRAAQVAQVPLLGTVTAGVPFLLPSILRSIFLCSALGRGRSCLPSMCEATV